MIKCCIEIRLLSLARNTSSKDHVDIQFQVGAVFQNIKLVLKNKKDLNSTREENWNIAGYNQIRK
jgi:hypothetical protein